MEPCHTNDKIGISRNNPSFQPFSLLPLPCHVSDALEQQQLVRVGLVFRDSITIEKILSKILSRTYNRESIQERRILPSSTLSAQLKSISQEK